MSDNLDSQLRNLEADRTFCMSSYLFYSLARTYRYRGLTCRGEVGNKENQFPVYDCYPQLHMEEKFHFKGVNDTFFMHITRTLQGGLHQRLSQESMDFISRFKYWYIQYPKFTYIRIQGFSRSPYKLPTYPTNRVVLLEVVRQLEGYMTVQRDKQKKAGTSSLTIGNGLETCPSSQAAATAKKELAWYPFYQYKARKNFDPFHKMKKVEGMTFEHKADLEDY